MKPETVDIFQFLNNVDGVKQELTAELFFFNKNYTPYTVAQYPSLDQHIQSLCLYPVISQVMLGAGTGMRVIDYDSEDTDNSVLRQDVDAVGRLDTLLYLIEKERNDIVPFNANEHDIKRVAGIVARYTGAGVEPFYVIKAIPSNKILTGAKSWTVEGGQLFHQTDVSHFEMPADNQLLVVKGDAFIFNRSKFEQLFKYDYKISKLAREKGAIIDEKFKINAAGTIDQGIEFLASEVKALHRRLANVDPELMELDQIAETAEKYQVNLMFDDNGGVILMDKSDVKSFLDLLEDNFVQGSIGKSYVANKKKELEL